MVLRGPACLLRFLQEPALSLSKGRVRCCLRHKISSDSNPALRAASYPPFATNAKDGPTHFCGCACDVQSLDHPSVGSFVEAGTWLLIFQPRRAELIHIEHLIVRRIDDKVFDPYRIFERIVILEHFLEWGIVGAHPPPSLL